MRHVALVSCSLSLIACGEAVPESGPRIIGPSLGSVVLGQTLYFHGSGFAPASGEAYDRLEALDGDRRRHLERHLG